MSPFSVGGSLRTNAKIAFVITLFSLATAVLVAFSSWQQEAGRFQRQSIDEAIDSSAKLSAKAELVLDTVFNAMGERPKWILAQGVAKLKGDQWQILSDGGSVDEVELRKFFHSNQYFQAAYLFSSEQTLFLKQIDEYQWQWKVTHFVPKLMNITMDLDGYSVRLLTNEKSQVIGVDRTRAGEIDQRLLKRPASANRDGAHGWQIVSKKEDRFVRSYSKVKRSNLTAVSIVKLKSPGLVVGLPVFIRFFSFLVFGLIINFLVLGIIKKSTGNLVRRLTGDESLEVDPEMQPILQEFGALKHELEQMADSKRSHEGITRSSVGSAQEDVGRDKNTEVDEQIILLTRFLVERIKQPTIALLGYLRLLKGQNLSASAGDSLSKIESEARRSRETLDLFTMFSNAEEWDKTSVVDMASLLGQFKYKYEQEFSRDQLILECSVSEGAFVQANEPHFRRVFELILRVLRQDHRLKLGWKLKIEEQSVVLEFIDVNGAVRDEDWKQLGRPFATIESRPGELCLALAAWNGSMKGYQIEPNWIRTSDGFICEYRLDLLSAEQFENHRTESREFVASRFAEKDEVELDSSAEATMVLSEPNLEMVRQRPSIDDVIGAILPSEDLIGQRKLSIDEFQVDIRPPKTGSPD